MCAQTSAFQTKLALLERILRAQPLGISEYELIKCLENEPQTDFSRKNLNDTLSLFQSHFLLFHSLYQLRNQLWQSKTASLDIHTLHIQLTPFNPSDACTLAKHDPLGDYYLDLNNLANTDQNAVDALLKQFWRRFVSADERQQALNTLALQDPVDWPTIKNQHRRLVMQHHPDRGGDKIQLQHINHAMDILTRAERPKKTDTRRK
jgi:DNA-J related protein